VDMEMSALMTVAGYYGIPAACMLVVSDKHNPDDNSAWQWGGDILDRNRKIAAELFLEFA